MLNFIQGFCNGKFLINKIELGTIVALLTSTNVPENVESKEEKNNKNESSIFDIMNNFIANSLSNNLKNTGDNKQSIKGKILINNYLESIYFLFD